MKAQSLALLERQNQVGHLRAKPFEKQTDLIKTRGSDLDDVD